MSNLNNPYSIYKDPYTNYTINEFLNGPKLQVSSNKEDIYNLQWESYRKKLALSIIDGNAKRININRELRKFRKHFDQVWDKQELGREAQLNLQKLIEVKPLNQVKTPLTTYSNTTNAFNTPIVSKEILDNKEINKFDEQIATQNAQFKKKRQDAYWLAEAQKYGGDMFKTLQDVINWLKAHGLYPDGKFGKKSKAMFEHLNLIKYLDEQRELLDWANEEQIRNEAEVEARARAEAKARAEKGIASSFITYNQQGGIMNKINYFQQGGSAPKQDIRAQVTALVQAAMQGDPKATQQVNQIMEAAKAGDQHAMKIAQIMEQVVKEIQGQVTSAKWGSKLGYIRSLKFAKGGKTCPACQAGATVPTVQDKAYIKPNKKVEEKACGGKAKKMKKRYFGGWL